MIQLHLVTVTPTCFSEHENCSESKLHVVPNLALHYRVHCNLTRTKISFTSCYFRDGEKRCYREKQKRCYDIQLERKHIPSIEK